MKIFEIKNEKSDTFKSKLVGVFLLRQAFDYLTLIALEKNVSKSNMLRMIIQQWFDGQIKNTDKLIDSIVSYLMHKWIIYKTIHSSTDESENFSNFNKQLISELKMKKLNDSYINEISKRLKNEKDKETRL